MRRLLIITSLVMLVILTACNSSGTLKIYNRTSFNVYMTAQGSNYTIPSHETLSLDIDTGTQTLFTGVREKKVPLTIYGETWMIETYQNGQYIYVKNTTVEVHSGQTTRIYCDPILAAVKVKNHSVQAITAMTYTVHQPPFENTTEVILPDSIQTNGEFFSSIPPLNPAPLDPPIYYTFQIRLSDGTWLSYGDTTTVPHVDQEFMIDVYDVSKNLAKLH
jgi:hypothetical protein